MCETLGCDQAPEYYDIMGNEVCADCMENEVNDECDVDYDDFEKI